MTACGEQRAFAPGRVNLLGDHTDYTGGFSLPMAIGLGTTVRWRPGPGGTSLRITSDDEAEPVELAPGIADGSQPPSAVGPRWARYVAAGAALARPGRGGELAVSSTLPIGSGLSSSTSLVIAVALALGAASSDPLELAHAAQAAEQAACGVPGGLLDQIAIVASRPGCGLLLDCGRLTWRPVRLPEDVAVVVVDSGEARALAASSYGERRRACDEAARIVGPLAQASLADLAQIADPVLRRRARHVVSENRRTLAFADALAAGDAAGAGRLMDESHASLAGDFAVSTRRLDELCAGLRSLPGVHGARPTGAGFGGCVVALTEPGTELPPGLAPRWWPVRPAGGATAG